MRFLSIILTLGISMSAFAQNVAKPTTLTNIPVATVATAKNPHVEFVTSLGTFVVEVNAQKAPITAKNFLSYVNKGFYNGTIFHRVIKGFMVQGGGFTKEMTKKATDKPIVLETGKGLSNVRGSIAMARTNIRNSATAQFFVNVVNNRRLDTMGGGYAVFGKVVKGMDVIDKIRNVKTTSKGGYQDVPEQTVVIQFSGVLP